METFPVNRGLTPPLKLSKSPLRPTKLSYDLFTNKPQTSSLLYIFDKNNSYTGTNHPIQKHQQQQLTRTNKLFKKQKFGIQKLFRFLSPRCGSALCVLRTPDGRGQSSLHHTRLMQDAEHNRREKTLLTSPLLRRIVDDDGRHNDRVPGRSVTDKRDKSNVKDERGG